MVMANYMFGGGITARLPDRVRNREGYSYSVGIELQRARRRRRRGVFGVGHRESGKHAEGRSELHGRTDENASRRIHGGGTCRGEEGDSRRPHRQARSSDGGVLNLIAAREQCGRTLAWDEQMDAKLQALTLDQVNAAFRRHINAGARFRSSRAAISRRAKVYQ